MKLLTILALLASYVLDMVPFKDCNYAILEQELPCTVVVNLDSVPSEVDLSPHSKGVKPVVDGQRVSFTLESYGQYQLLVDGHRYFIFADAPASKVEGRSVMSYKKVDNSGRKDVTAAVQKAIDETAANGTVLVFPEGIYLCRQLTLPSNAHLHLERGAVIKANPSSVEDFIAQDEVKTKRFINIKNAQNVKVTGSGAINGSGRELREAFGDDARMRLVMGIKSSDILFEGVMLQDPGSWNTQMLYCDNVTYRNVKLMNDYDLSNTDGFDPDASKNVLFENSFAMCSDDNVAIKTTGYSGHLRNLNGVTVRSCVFITKKSSLKIGTETKGKTMSNIVFEDNDVLEFDRGMAVYVSDGASVENVRYSNNRFERYATNVQYNNGQTSSYKVKGKLTGLELSVKGRNEKSRIGSIRNLVIENCSFEQPFLKDASIFSVPEGTIEVKFVNLTVAGQKIGSAAEGKIKVTSAEVLFE